MAKIKINRTKNISPAKAIELAKPTVKLFWQYNSGQRLNWAQEAAKDIEFVNNVQWEIPVANALENDNQPVVVNNETKVSRDRVIGQLTENNPRWIATPRESSDTELAGSISDFGSYIWDSSKGRMHFRKAVEDFEDIGVFILHAYYDPNADMGKGEIKIIRIDPQKWFCDPRCNWRNAEDASNQILSDILSEDKIRMMYPDFNFTDAVQYKGEIKRYGTGSIQEGQIFKTSFLGDEKYYQIIDRYQKLKADMFWVYDSNSNFEKVMDKAEYIKFAKKEAIILVQRGREKAITDELEVSKFKRLVQQYSDIFHEMSDGSIMQGTEEHGQAQSTGEGQIIFPVPGSTTQIRFVTMSDLLHEGKIQWQIVPVDRIKRTIVIGEKLYRELLMPISEYPFGITMLHHTDNVYAYGDARLTRSIQEQINKISSIIISYNINISSLRAFIQKDSMSKKELEERWGKAGAQFFEYDADIGGPPIIVQLTQMSNSFFLQLDRLRNLIERIYGAYDFQDGQISAPPNTASGTMQIDEAGMRRSKAKLQLIEEALNDLGTVVAEMIPYVYTERKLIRILTPNNGKFKEIIFNKEIIEDDIVKIKNDITVNRYDLKMISASTLPTNRAARFNAYLRLYEIKAIKDPTPLLRLTDLPDIEEIIQNESLVNQAQQNIEQLQQVIKSLQGDLQTANREKVHADQKVLLAKTKSNLDSLVARANAAVLLGKQRTDDVVKNFKAKVNETLENVKQNSGTSKPDGDASEPQGE